MRRLAAVILASIAQPVLAQVNEGHRAASAELPFDIRRIAEFSYPWRMAALPDGQMLITEKSGKLFLVSPTGSKTAVSGVPPVLYSGQGGLLGVFVSPDFARDRSIYLTYAEPGRGEGQSGLALARARLVRSVGETALVGSRVVWRDPVKGRGGQFGGALAFAPDGKSLFLAVGDRQRFLPAQDMNQVAGKILHLTLDGKPAAGNPWAAKRGKSSIALIDPPENSVEAEHAPIVGAIRMPHPNRSPAMIWSLGHRTPYGLAFAPDGNLWEIEHGPDGGDELNLIKRGANYGWPLVSYGSNYDGVPMAHPDTRPDLAKPVIYWSPVIAPGNFAFYNGNLFPQWKGDAFVAGLGSESLSRLRIVGRDAHVTDKWSMNFRVRDVAQAKDGSLWLIEDSAKGGLYVLPPK